MRILGVLGAILVVAWIVLWLAIKITVAAVHLLLAVGIVLLLIAFLSGTRAGSNT
jgi:hypothetical protein